jgi:hypothetical protein
MHRKAQRGLTGGRSDHALQKSHTTVQNRVESTHSSVVRDFCATAETVRFYL